eukprot:1314731-Pleurochrysis_carterae.AAC.2
MARGRLRRGCGRALPTARQGRQSGRQDLAHALAQHRHSGVAQIVWAARARAWGVGRAAALLNAWPLPPPAR